MTTATVIVTKQADAQLDQLPEEMREKALKLCTKLSEPKFTKATRLSPAPFGEGWVWKFRTGTVRVIAVVDENFITVVGFGLRQQRVA
jgi:mRNA-degrading endonuclease RelE of RelBE toxin-antitoxin system